MVKLLIIYIVEFGKMITLFARRTIQEASPLMVPLDEGLEPAQGEIKKKWFGQDVLC